MPDDFGWDMEVRELAMRLYVAILSSRTTGEPVTPKELARRCFRLGDAFIEVWRDEATRNRSTG